MLSGAEISHGNQQVLNASVHDVRYIAALLRGVNIGTVNTIKPSVYASFTEFTLACHCNSDEKRIHSERGGSTNIIRYAMTILRSLVFNTHS